MKHIVKKSVGILVLAALLIVPSFPRRNSAAVSSTTQPTITMRSFAITSSNSTSCNSRKTVAKVTSQLNLALQDGSIHPQHAGPLPRHVFPVAFLHIR